MPPRRAALRPAPTTAESMEGNMAWSRTVALALAAALAGAEALADTVLLEFTSPTCGPCHAMRPVIQQLNAAGYAVRVIDVSREPAVAAQHRVRAVPTFVVLVDGHERARWEGGGQTFAQLSAMIDKASALGSPSIDYVGASSAATGAPAADGPQSFAEPRPGRVVPLDAKPPVVAAQPPATPAGAAPGGDVATLVAASVRLTVEDPNGKSTGTGTIVDARQGKALVLTCGHIFRESKGQGAITISQFKPGPAGAELCGTVEGTLIDYDLQRDLALVCFVTSGPTAVAPIAPAGTLIRTDLSATSVGCQHGANPTPWPTRITAVNRYQGHPNIEAAGAPQEGRSGGGLFNAAGQLIGVCNCADPQGDAGLYAGLDSIHQKLDAMGLAFVHQSPSQGAAATNALASQPSPAASVASPAALAPATVQVRGQDPAADGVAGTANVLGSTTVNPFAQATAAQQPPQLAAAQPQVAPAAAGPGAAPPVRQVAPADIAPAAFTAEEQAALAEINRRAAEAEVIFIVTPRTPGGRSEVIKLDRASPAFLEALRASAGDAAAARPLDRQAASALTR
ncbi:MAG: hypothetical protein DCC67_00645 [Planctomycetota bacterium]|nr:MAG: hypothetical protein DCC67_00645 [Planctomycetota bacterium]